MATKSTKPILKVWCKTTICVLLLLVSSPGLSAEDFSMETRAAFLYLNRIRGAAGMIPFAWNPSLAQSAFSHASYLTENKIISHHEVPGKPYYSGKTPGDRAMAKGYEMRHVTENQSLGGKDPLESVDGLMSAIYHRFGFLDFTKDEVGIGLTASRNGFTIVYNMGNGALNRYCKEAKPPEAGTNYRGVCKKSQIVSANEIDRREAETAGKNPAIVVWPPDQSINIPTVFYDEIPDPLPTISVSGYPISVQFNPGTRLNIKLLRFDLHKAGVRGEEQIAPLHILTSQNDPNQKFDENQFALFPLNRLEWGTRYRVNLAYMEQGRVSEKSWTFTTEFLPHPLFMIAAKGESLVLTPHKTYAVYIPPSSRLPYIEQLRVEAPYTVRVDANWKDRNTLLLTLSGRKCQPATFSLNGGRIFTVRLDNADNINVDHYYPELSPVSCLENR